LKCGGKTGPKSRKETGSDSEWNGKDLFSSPLRGKTGKKCDFFWQQRKNENGFKYFQLAKSSGGEATHPREGDGIGGAA